MISKGKCFLILSYQILSSPDETKTGQQLLSAPLETAGSNTSEVFSWWSSADQENLGDDTTQETYSSNTHRILS